MKPRSTLARLHRSLCATSAQLTRRPLPARRPQCMHVPVPDAHVVVILIHLVGTQQAAPSALYIWNLLIRWRR
eukprot:3489154-Pyramimonas_sp.AAC.1